MLRAVGGALEGKMFEEVCCAIGPIGFRPAAGIDPDTDGGSLRPGRVLGRDLQKELSPVYIALADTFTVRPFDRVVLSVVTP